MNASELEKLTPDAMKCLLAIFPSILFEDGFLQRLKSAEPLSGEEANVLHESWKKSLKDTSTIEGML